MVFIRWVFTTIALLVLLSCQAKGPQGVSAKFDVLRDQDVLLRAFLQDMPKGADLHNHLYGAVYPESWIGWAEQDGLCFEPKLKAIRPHKANGKCTPLQTVKSALAGNQVLRNELIDLYSVRDFKAENGWSGHDQFFQTFALIFAKPERLGDMLAETAARAGRQNVQYLELLHTEQLFDGVLPLLAKNGLIGSGEGKNLEEQYDRLMAGPFGVELPKMIARARQSIKDGMARKDQLLGCQTYQPKNGCDVEIRFLHQVVRILPPEVVFAYQILGWHLIEQEPLYVGANLVAPEDDFIALRDYNLHMRQLAFLRQKLGDRNLSLHAGELWLGLVHTKNLRDHIRQAIETAGAKRIGHGTDIIFEDGYRDLLKQMGDHKIAVEISPTSSDVILGVAGNKHPLSIYRNANIPIVISTDDEGVSRIDLTHEYQRMAQDHELDYQALKKMSYDSLRYSFLDPVVREKLLKQLEQNFTEFEAKF